MVNISIEIPEVVLESYHHDLQVVKTEIQQSIMIWEYLNGHLSLRQCSELLHINYRHFLELLWNKGIPLDGLNPEEIELQTDYLCQHLKLVQK